MASRGFRDQVVYRMAYRCGLEICQLSKRFPRDERYELTVQIRRSSRAVPALIAEGYRCRKYPSVFVNKMSEADAEGAETQVWLDFSKDCEYMPADDHVQLIDRYEQIGRMLHKMIDNPDSFCG